MKKFLILVVLAAMFSLTGCETIAHKDVSLKVRSGIVDVDYDSRVAIDPEKFKRLKALDDLKESDSGKLHPIAPIAP